MFLIMSKFFKCNEQKKHSSHSAAKIRDIEVFETITDNILVNMWTKVWDDDD